jgi:hypothetical protein
MYKKVKGLLQLIQEDWPLLWVSVIDKDTVDAVLILKSQLEITVIFCGYVKSLPSSHKIISWILLSQPVRGPTSAFFWITDIRKLYQGLTVLYLFYLWLSFYVFQKCLNELTILIDIGGSFLICRLVIHLLVHFLCTVQLTLLCSHGFA